jgi:hypothetical protein
MVKAVPGFCSINLNIPNATRERLRALSTRWDLNAGEALTRCIDVVHQAFAETPLVPPPKRRATPAPYVGPTPADPYAGLIVMED